MFASLQTLRTHCLHFQYDFSNVPSHTEHVKRSLETSKIEKKAKICWFSGFAAITKRKNLAVKIFSREVNIFQNPFNSTFLNLNAKKIEQLVETWTWWGEKLWRFCVFFWSRVVNSATVIFGAKMAVMDEILNVYKLADSQNPLSALPIWFF